MLIAFNRGECYKKTSFIFGIRYNHSILWNQQNMQTTFLHTYIHTLEWEIREWEGPEKNPKTESIPSYFKGLNESTFLFWIIAIPHTPPTDKCTSPIQRQQQLGLRSPATEKRKRENDKKRN